MNYDNEFKIALKQEKEYEEQFSPIINELNSIKSILQENFLVYKKVTKIRNIKVRSKWFWMKEKDKEETWEEEESFPLIKDFKIINTFVVDNHPYILVAKIEEGPNIYAEEEFVMSIGKFGDLKDKVFIVPPKSQKKHEEMPIITNWSGCTNYFYLSNKITIVQLFTIFIKKYKKYLKSE